MESGSIGICASASSGTDAQLHASKLVHPIEATKTSGGHEPQRQDYPFFLPGEVLYTQIPDAWLKLPLPYSVPVYEVVRPEQAPPANSNATTKSQVPTTPRRTKKRSKLQSKLSSRDITRSSSDGGQEKPCYPEGAEGDENGPKNHFSTEASDGVALRIDLTGDGAGGRQEQGDVSSSSSGAEAKSEFILTSAWKSFIRIFSGSSSGSDVSSGQDPSSPRSNVDARSESPPESETETESGLDEAEDSLQPRDQHESQEKRSEPTQAEAHQLRRLQFEYVPGTLLITSYRVLFLGPPSVASQDAQISGQMPPEKLSIGVERMCLLDLPVGALAGTAVDRSVCWSTLHHFVGESAELQHASSSTPTTSQLNRSSCWAATWDSAGKPTAPQMWKKLVDYGTGAWKRGPAGLLSVDHRSTLHPHTSSVPFCVPERSRLLPIVPATVFANAVANKLESIVERILSSNESLSWVQSFRSRPSNEQQQAIARVSKKLARSAVYEAIVQRIPSTSAASTINPLLSSTGSACIAQQNSLSQCEGKDVDCSARSMASTPPLASTSLWVPISHPESTRTQRVIPAAENEDQMTVDASEVAAFRASSSYPFGHFGSKLLDQLDVHIPSMDVLQSIFEDVSPETANSYLSEDEEEELCVSGTLWGPRKTNRSGGPDSGNYSPLSSPRNQSESGSTHASESPPAPSSPTSRTSTEGSTQSLARSDPGSQPSQILDALSSNSSKGSDSSYAHSTTAPSFSRLARLALCSKVPLQIGLSPVYYTNGYFYQPVTNLSQIQPSNIEPHIQPASEAIAAALPLLPQEALAGLASTHTCRPRTSANNVTSAVSTAPSLTLNVAEIIIRSPSATFADSLCLTLARLNRSVLPAVQQCDDNREIENKDKSNNVATLYLDPHALQKQSSTQPCFAQQHAAAIFQRNALSALQDTYAHDLGLNSGWGILDPISEAVRSGIISRDVARNFVMWNIGGNKDGEGINLVDDDDPRNILPVSAAYVALESSPLPDTSSKTFRKIVSTPSLVKSLLKRIDCASRELAIRQSTDESAPAQLRISAANSHYALCSSYPPIIVAPKTIDDDKLAVAAGFRTHNRLPIPTWRHPKTGALLIRASQPKTGFSSRSTADEALTEALVRASQLDVSEADRFAENATVRAHFLARGFSPDLVDRFIPQSTVTVKTSNSLAASPTPQADSNRSDASGSNLSACASEAKTPGTQAAPRLAIFDCRDNLAAWGNAVMGGGFEKAELYCGGASFSFLDIPNIHSVSNAVVAAVTKVKPTKPGESILPNAIGSNSNTTTSNSCASPNVKFGGLDKELTPALHQWYDAVLAVLKGASRVAAALACGETALVHCSDNVDRTTQVSFLAQVLLEPRFRTLSGICLLLEKEWVVFGHRFRERAGLDENGLKNKLSPVFAQAMDCLYQLMNLFPTEFEFNELFLIDVVHSIYSARFGAFLFDTHQDLVRAHAHATTLSPWSHFLSKSIRARYISPRYRSDSSEVLTDLPRPTPALSYEESALEERHLDNGSESSESKEVVSDTVIHVSAGTTAGNPALCVPGSQRLVYVLTRENLIPWKSLLYPGWGWYHATGTRWFDHEMERPFGTM